MGAVLADAELRVLVTRLGIRAAKAPDSMAYVKAQLRRILDEDEERERRTESRPAQHRPARHIKGSG